MRHIDTVVVLALAAGLLVASLPFPGAADVAAQGRKDDDKDKKERKEKERKKREDTLKRIGGEFGAKDTESLLGRVPRKAKIHLTLTPDTNDDYSVAQARGVLDAWFDKFQTLTAEFDKAEEGVGSFSLKLRKSGGDKDIKLKLFVTVGSADAGYPLTRLSVEK